MSNLQKLVSDAKQWVEQERVWDDSLFASSSPRSERAREEVSESKGVRSAPPPVLPRSRAPSPAKAAALKELYVRYKDCTRCPLGFTRIKFVFGVGSPDAEVLFIGEGPGYEEDHRGEPFVGKAGQLLDKMLEAIGMSRRTNAYIANIVKCHAMVNPQSPEVRGNDRPPNPEEVETCAPILLQQIKIIMPRVVVTLGSPSTKMILKTKDGITSLRGRYFPFPVSEHFSTARNAPAEVPLFEEERPKEKDDAQILLHLSDLERAELAKIQVLPTYHPAALLRNPNLKPESWADLKLLRESLNHP